MSKKNLVSVTSRPCSGWETISDDESGEGHVTTRRLGGNAYKQVIVDVLYFLDGSKDINCPYQERMGDDEIYCCLARSEHLKDPLLDSQYCPWVRY